MTYKINGKPVGDIGYGLMSLTMSANPHVSEEDAFTAIKTAIDCGCNYLNGSIFYGPPDNNSLTLLRKYFAKYPEDLSKVVINIKGALNAQFAPANTKAEVTESIEKSLKMLGPDIHMDQFETARYDPKIDYENETLAAIDEYVKAGKIGEIACSAIGVETLRQAAKRYKIGAVEIELSLFQREPLDNGLLAACAEFDVPVLAYSPLGGGLLGGQVKSLDDIPVGDVRRYYPHFSPENFPKNLDLVNKVQELATKKGCTTGQIAIGWILSLSKKPGMPKIIPIPGTRNPARIKENATVVDLTDEDLAGIDAILASFV